MVLWILIRCNIDCVSDKDKRKWSYKNFLMAALIKNTASWPMRIERSKIAFYCLLKSSWNSCLFLCLPPNLTAVLCRLRKSFSDIKSQHGPSANLPSAFNTKKKSISFREVSTDRKILPVFFKVPKSSTTIASQQIGLVLSENRFQFNI